MPKSLLVVFIHMLDDAGFGLAKRILKTHFLRFDPKDLPESSDEARSQQMNAVKGKVVRLKVRFRRRKIPQIPATDFRVSRINRLHISDPGQPPGSLRII